MCHGITFSRLNVARYFQVRTPLNSVCMGLQLLGDNIGRFARSSKNTDSQASPETVSAHVEKNLKDWLELSGDILTNTHSAVSVLNDLLNYDKIERGTLQLELTVVQIWDLVERTVSEFHYPALVKNIKMHVDYSSLVDQGAIAESGLATVSAANLSERVREQKVVGDSVRITQVLRNFLSNAIKFTPEGGESQRVVHNLATQHQN